MVLDNEISQALESFFPQVEALYDWQETALERIFRGENVLVVMATGAGKSLCYQLPSVIASEINHLGLTVVISPLVALMGDQVQVLSKNNVRAVALNSQLSYRQQKEVLRQLVAGEYSIVFVAPERLRDGLFLAALDETHVPLCVVDEAHCISEWGHDFRVDYLQINGFLKRVKHPQVIALTATATDIVQNEIQTQLGIQYVQRTGGVVRKNLRLSVRQVPKDDKDSTLVDVVKEVRSEAGPTIVYTAGRDSAERLSELCKAYGYRSEHFHAERTDSEKRRVYREFMNDRIDVLCATNAFGMGIDKPNIRAIIHYNAPGSIDAYYQEIGRGGRDGDRCECVLLYTPQDLSIQKSFISSTFPNAARVQSAFVELFDFSGVTQQSVPIGMLYDERNAAGMLLRSYEAVDAIEKQTEYLHHCPIEFIQEPPPQKNRTLWNQLHSLVTKQHTLKIPKVAEQLGMELEALQQNLYRFLLWGFVDIANRDSRNILYSVKRNQLSGEDLNAIGLSMNERRAYKLQRLNEIQGFANSSRCLWKIVARHYGEDT